MLNLSQDVLDKINNPIQLPSNNSDPRLLVTLSNTVTPVEGSEDLSNWTLLNTGGATITQTFEDGVNELSVTPGAGRERFYYAIAAEAGKTYTCSYYFCSPSGFSYNGNYTPDNTVAEYSFIHTNYMDMNNFEDLGQTNPWNNTASNDYIFYRMTYTCKDDATVYFVIPFENLLDNTLATIVIRDLVIYESTTYDITDQVIGGSVSYNNDNKIANMKLSINNAIYNFNVDNIPYKPGVEVIAQTKFGEDGDLIDLCSIFVDEVNWTLGNKTFSISGRNHLARLKETYCGTLLSASGYSHEVLAELLEHAGITNYDLTIGDYEYTYIFKATDTIAQAIAQLYVMFPGFDIIETPSGKVVIGYWPIRNQYLPVGVYSFNIDDDIFTRSVRQCSDAVYSKIYATGHDENGEDLEPVIVPIQNWSTWNINPNKYYFIESDVAVTQEELENWAEGIAEEFKYVGITEELSGPFRPQISIGDVASITKNGEETRLGLITSITHNFSMEEGFTTDFSVDSGGVYTSLGGNTKSKALRGYNRHQTMADLIRSEAEKVIEEKVPKISYTVVTKQSSSGGGSSTRVDPRNTIVLSLADD